MTEHDRVIDDPVGERIAALEARVAALEAALTRVAAYLGVAHVAQDPTV
jgi:BMFP domain-containing protein YqiC